MVEPTVKATPVEGHNALLMSWQHKVDKDDVRECFEDISAYLDRADTPTYIIVDLNNDPLFPLAETITGAFWGPFRHPMLAEWLVVGSSSVARTIGRTLVGISRRDNIRWFHTLEQATEYLDGKDRHPGLEMP